MNKFIDIHTHRHSENENVFEITNILIHKEKISKTGYYSVGWHPWFIDTDQINNIENQILSIINSTNVLAIGETGLDRSIKIPFILQDKIFKLHLKISTIFKKHVIVHCVQAYADLLEILKKENPSIPLILHDFNGNEQLIEQFLRYNVYFSFGSRLLKNIPKKVNSFRLIPLYKLFLETDDSLESIEKIYLHASNLLSVKTEVLKKQIEINFKTVFGDGLVE